MRILPQEPVIREEQNWLTLLKNAISDPKLLLETLNLSEKHFEQSLSARKLFALRVPQPFVDKIEKGNPNDPLFLQVMCSELEFLQAEGFSTDPLEEQNANAVPNILHKYQNRLLFMVKGGCAVNCRYCFRRHFPYDENPGNKKSWQGALDYIATHSEIEEVIFSGGDPLMAKDDELEWLIKRLENLPHLQRLRIHTRLPIVIPQRITDKLCLLLAESRLKVVMVTHINHPNEIDERLSYKMQKLKGANVTLLNQSVLLKGINDEAMILKNLSDKLFQIGILPYYLHLLDKVQGASHFFIDDTKAVSLYKELQSLTSGYLVPKLAREIAGEPNKTLYAA
ncbi:MULTISPECIES: EF-P beta-lysylation protein EpmB [Rodentibacter]|uniref:EF-P beta-lysylation protein EpmB n=1 Tax=Rodentibacter TaxID=1960084 RepID=UPI001CFDCCBF|nr:EF-P beta-lysylation protein EpmB [Rodentibacter sp. JRC1]GJI56256.1 L-lysine 2,3-aminomutase [Rodentibacter sp. JRC1]